MGPLEGLFPTAAGSTSCRDDHEVAIVDAVVLLVWRMSDLLVVRPIGFFADFMYMVLFLQFMICCRWWRGRHTSRVRVCGAPGPRLENSCMRVQDGELDTEKEIGDSSEPSPRTATPERGAKPRTGGLAFL